jgi:putative FmdB family regulatory protein
MPLYQYQCSKCSNIYESFVSLHIGPNNVDNTIHPDCPLCSAHGKKIISAVSFKINGYSEKNGYSKEK